MADESLASLAGLPLSYANPAGPDYANGDAAGQDTVDAIAGTAVPQPKPGILSNTTTVDPKTGEQTHTLKVTDQFLQNIGQLVGVGQQAISAYDQSIQAVQQKQQFLQRHPILAGVGRLASLAASNYLDQRNRLGPAIRAAGVFGQDLYGQTPDQLGLQVAQLQSQKLQTQMGLASVLEKGSAAEQMGQMRALDEQRRQDQLKLNQQQAREKIVTDELARAGREESSPDAALAAAQRFVANGGTKDEAAQAYGQIISAQNAATAKRLATEAFTTKRDTERYAEQEKLSDKRTVAMMAMANNRFNQQDKMAAQKELEIPPADSNGLKGASGLENNLKAAKQLYIDYRNNTGPFAGRVLTLEQKIGMLNGELAKLRTVDQSTTAFMVKSLGEGARGYTKFETGFNQAMKPSVKFDINQNLGTIDGLMQMIHDIRVSTAGNLNKFQVAQHPALFGSHYADSLKAAADPSPFMVDNMGKIGIRLPQEPGVATGQAEFNYDPATGKLVPVKK